MPQRKLFAPAFAVIACALDCASPAMPQPPVDWREAEASALRNHVQLTFAERFTRAGEAYFSPDDSQIIFQANEVPRTGETAEAHYQMYVADLVRRADGRLTGIEHIKRLSPPGSSNTCGWFHPTKPRTVIFGSTLVSPSQPEHVGYQRGSNRYVWAFPKEMTIVECNIDEADGTASTLTPLVHDPNAYLAECVMSHDGRWLAYCRRSVAEGTRGGDLLIRDLTTGRDVVVAGNAGYDGGPFFSPDGKRLCYRSDRRGNDLLQLFVAELAFDDAGEVTGTAREFQLTDNIHVNWAPYWHPSGRYLIYTTSQLGHENYEVFMLDADPGAIDGTRPAKYGTRKRRLTHGPGFDGLPVFNADGSLMMWTAQRDEHHTSQIWAADFVLDPEPPSEGREDRVEPQDVAPDEVHVKDPDRNLIYIYNTTTHAVTAYDPTTHEARSVTDQAELARVMELFRKKDRDDTSGG